MKAKLVAANAIVVVEGEEVVLGGYGVDHTALQGLLGHRDCQCGSILLKGLDAEVTALSDIGTYVCPDRVH